MRSLAERERHSLTANLVAWAGCLVAALALPVTHLLILPLVLRLAAMTSTRLTSIRLRASLAAGKPIEKDLSRVGMSLAFAGVSWALILVPVLPLLKSEGFAIVIVGVTIVGVSLICSMLGPLRTILFGFVAAFLGTLTIGLYGTQTLIDPAIILAATAMTVGMVSFSVGAGRQMQETARTLVENRRLSEELAEALAKAEFLSKRDPLTGLFNRRAFFELSGDAEGRARSSGHMLVVDLDHFKRINDSFGHGIGDRVLAATGDAIRAVLRTLPGDDQRAVRLGGEEFAILLNKCDYESAHRTAEDLRAELAHVAEELRIDGLRVTASIGIAKVASGKLLSQALEQADKALYIAKNAGRDRVVSRAA